jgi:hypothetical protein
MHLIRKDLGSILDPKTMFPEVFRGFVQLLHARAVLHAFSPIRDLLIIVLFAFIQGVSIQGVPGKICCT